MHPVATLQFRIYDLMDSIVQQHELDKVIGIN
jgi:hypothetical protein